MAPDLASVDLDQYASTCAGLIDYVIWLEEAHAVRGLQVICLDVLPVIDVQHNLLREKKSCKHRLRSIFKG
jgi:hypothetical protein